MCLWRANVTLTDSQGLLLIQFKYFTCIITCDPHNNLVMEVLFVSLC